MVHEDFILLRVDETPESVRIAEMALSVEKVLAQPTPGASVFPRTTLLRPSRSDT